MSIKGFVLAIAGATIMFGTDGSWGGSISSTDPLWWTDAPIENHVLAWPEIAWTERAKPIDGDLDVDAITLRIIDAGEVATRMFTTDESANVSTPITSAMADSDTFAFVANASIFTVGTYAWIERECVKVTGVGTGSITIDRAQLGTRAVAHATSYADNRRPEIFTSPPWAAVQRNAFLWAVRDDNTVVLLYQGFTRRPRLLDGGTFEITIEHLHTVLREQKVGQYFGSAELVGVGAFAAPVMSSTLWLEASGTPQLTATTGTATRFRDALSCVQRLADATYTRILGATTSTTRHVDAVIAGPNVTMRAVWTGGDKPLQGAVSGSLAWDGVGHVVYAQILGDGSTVRALKWDVPALACAYVVRAGRAQDFYLRSALSLPTTWDGTPITTEGRTTVANRVLRAQLDDDYHVVFNGVAIDAATFTLTATSSFVRRTPSAPDLAGASHLVSRPRLEVCLQVACDHWIDGWRYGVLPELSRETWDDQWDWSRVDVLARATAGSVSRRVMYYDSGSEVGELLSQDCILTGCSPVVRANGRMALWNWGIPSPSDESVATYTRNNIVGDVVSWQQWAEGVLNSVELKFGGSSIQVNEARSFERYGRGRNLALELKGLTGDALRELDPTQIKSTLLRRLLLWSEPIYAIMLEVPIDDVFVVFLGDVVTVTDWVAPNGAGSRGLTDARAVVWAKRPDVGAGKLQLECLLFGRTSYGYSPVAVAESVIDEYSLQFALNPFCGTHAYNGVANSYGLEDFAPGDVIELTLRDDTTALTWQGVIALRNAGLGVVSFTDAIDSDVRNAIDDGRWISMRYATFSECTTDQRAAFAFVGGDATNTIDGTDEPARKIAP